MAWEYSVYRITELHRFVENILGCIMSLTVYEQYILSLHSIEIMLNPPLLSLSSYRIYTKTTTVCSLKDQQNIHDYCDLAKRLPDIPKSKAPIKDTKECRAKDAF